MLGRMRGMLAAGAAGSTVVLVALSGGQAADAHRILHGHLARALRASGLQTSALRGTALQATDEARLRYVSTSGSTLYEVGHASGTLPGPMKVHMRVEATFSGSFTISAPGGSIEGHGSASPHGVGVYESFAGWLTVTGGSGRYTHAHGTARLYGTFNRDSYALVIQTLGTLRY
jgi:hypothetical protein